MPKTCTHCGADLGAAVLEVHVAKEFEREAPTGVFHIGGTGEGCFDKAVADHRRMIADAELVIGVE